MGCRVPSNSVHGKEGLLIFTALTQEPMCGQFLNLDQWREEEEHLLL